MAVETQFTELEEAHQRFSQLLHAEVMKREVSEIKVQVQIKGMEAKMQEQFGVVSDKLDNLANVLASIQQQLHKFNKGKASLVESQSRREPAQDFIIKEKIIVGEDLGLREAALEWINKETLISPDEAHANKLQIGQKEYYKTSKPLSSEENWGKITPLSLSNINNNDDILGTSNLEDTEKREGIGVQFLTKISKGENICKIPHNSLQVFVSSSEFRLDVISNTHGIDRTKIGLRKNINPRSSHFAALNLNENLAKEVSVEKLVKENIPTCSMVILHVDSAKSITIGHFINKLGSTDNRFVERFKKDVGEGNGGSFNYSHILDKLGAEQEQGINTSSSHWKFEATEFCYYMVVDVFRYGDYIKNLTTGSSRADCIDISNDGQARKHSLLAFALGVKQINCCRNKMGAKVPTYSKVSYDRISKDFSSYLKKVGFNVKILFVPIDEIELAFSKMFRHEILTDFLVEHMSSKCVPNLRLVFGLAIEVQRIAVREMTDMRRKITVLFNQDNHMDEAVEGACIQLPGIAVLYIYLKVAHSLLERLIPTAVLMPLRSARDWAATLASFEKIDTDFLISTEVGRYIVGFIPALLLYVSLYFLVCYLQAKTFISTRISYWLNLGLFLPYIIFSPSCAKTRPCFRRDVLWDLRGFFRDATPIARMAYLKWWFFEIIILVPRLMPNPKLHGSIMSIRLTMALLHYHIPYSLGDVASTLVGN